MGVMSNRISKEDLKPGDHVYTWRTAYTYGHHGIYMGDGNIVHFTRVGTGTILDQSIFSSSLPSRGTFPCEKCGNNIHNNGVILSCIDCFLSGDSLYLFEYSVSIPLFLAKVRGGTCTLACSDPPVDVLHRANYLLRNGFGNYNLFSNNCEDFAIYCKTGLLVQSKFGVGRSGQMGSVVAAMGAVTSSPVQFLSGGFASTVMFVTAYSLHRYRSDIGVRKDVKKYAVETLALEMDKAAIDMAVATNGLTDSITQ